MGTESLTSRRQITLQIFFPTSREPPQNNRSVLLYSTRSWLLEQLADETSIHGLKRPIACSKVLLMAQ
jgi:hypothetical protein